MENGVGLERKLSAVNVWALALGCIIGWGAFVMPGNTFLVKAGPLGTAIAMGAAAVIMIIIAFNYHYMINRFPVAGGEFTYAQRAFGRGHGFVCSWFLSLSYLAIVPLNATALALIGRNLLGGVFQVGFHYTVAGYDVYWGEILLATTALVLFAWLAKRGVKGSGRFQTLLTFVLVGGVALVSAAALLSPAASWEKLSPAFAPTGSEVSGVLAVIAVSPWAFVGFDTVPQAAEEYRFSPKKTRVIMIVSILFGATVYVALNTVTAAAVPQGYDNWAAYIADLSACSGLQALPTFHAAKRLLGDAGLLVIGAAVLAAILSGIVGFYMAASRLLYAMARDNTLPAWFARLDGKSRTPGNAILFVMGVSLIAPFFGRTALGWIVDMSSIGAAIGYGYTSAAALKYARQERNRFVTVTGAAGTLLSLVFVGLLLVPVPALGCSLGGESWICLAAWSVLGLLFSVLSGRKRR